MKKILKNIELIIRKLLSDNLYLDSHEEESDASFYSIKTNSLNIHLFTYISNNGIEILNYFSLTLNQKDFTVRLFGEISEEENIKIDYMWYFFNNNDSKITILNTGREDIEEQFKKVNLLVDKFENQLIGFLMEII